MDLGPLSSRACVPQCARHGRSRTEAGRAIRNAISARTVRRWSRPRSQSRTPRSPSRPRGRAGSRPRRRRRIISNTTSGRRRRRRRPRRSTRPAGRASGPAPYPAPSTLPTPTSSDERLTPTRMLRARGLTAHHRQPSFACHPWFLTTRLGLSTGPELPDPTPPRSGPRSTTRAGPGRLD